MTSNNNILNDYILIQDFDSVERGHSKPRFEAQIIDGGNTVAIVETNPIGESEKMHYIPKYVFLDIAYRIVDAENEEEAES